MFCSYASRCMMENVFVRICFPWWYIPPVRFCSPTLLHSLKRTSWIWRLSTCWWRMAHPQWWAAMAPLMTSPRCLDHQSLLCAKLSGELRETMDSVMAIINFICCTSSLQHCLFCKLLTDMSAEYIDFFIHSDIRWHSKANALNRRIVVFLWSLNLKKVGKFLSLMGNDKFNATVCFLSDIFHHLNQLSGVAGQRLDSCGARGET